MPIVLLICLLLMVRIKNRRVYSYLRNLRSLLVVNEGFEVTLSILILIAVGYATNSRFTSSIIVPSIVNIRRFSNWVLLNEIFLFDWQICWWPIIDYRLFLGHRHVLVLRRSKWCSAFFVTLLHIRILVLVLERCWVLLFKVGLSFKALTHVVLLKVQLLWEHVEVINLVTRLDKCRVDLH